MADGHLCAMGVPVFPLDGPEAQAAMPVSPMVAALKPFEAQAKDSCDWQWHPCPASCCTVLLCLVKCEEEA